MEKRKKIPIAETKENWILLVVKDAVWYVVQCLGTRITMLCDLYIVGDWQNANRGKLNEETKLTSG